MEIINEVTIVDKVIFEVVMVIFGTVIGFVIGHCEGRKSMEKG